MIDFECNSLARATNINDIGEWLDKNMANPPLPDAQRWSIGYANDGTYRMGIRFFNDEDATLFGLVWGGRYEIEK